IISAGPFEVLDPGESLNFQTAYVVGPGFDGFIRNAVSAQRIFNGRYVDADANPETGVNGLERCLRALEPGTEVSWDDPCDTLMVTVDHRSSRCLWVDADCNPCTGVGGQETLVNWVGITAPVSPNSNITPVDPGFSAFARPGEDREVTLLWDNKPELQVDPLTGQNLFEGYRVWRVDNWQRPVGAIGPSPNDWMLVGEFRRNPKDGLGVRSPQHLLEVTDRNIVDIGQTDDGKNIYPIGRYKFVDRNGVVNGKVYYYSVTAFGVTSRRNDATGELEDLEIAGLPTATEAQAVIPRWDSAGGCESVAVVPNPYRGGAAWDLIPSQKDPTGTKIALRNLPKAVSRVRIYTLAGDLVRSDRHDGRGGDGTYFWNLISKNGQDVVSGIYLYTVEYAGDVCRGRFVIIR
ncbi:MAG: hypothetical protein HKN21_03230, partial [Candidatus Eisenbacteria bacterium]|nr:hypothetical protein [Candidatus Eisenbacteria bacterium]